MTIDAGTADADFLRAVRAIVRADITLARRMVAAQPALALHAARGGATRSDASTFFFKEISHYLYEGDTLLHLTAAAFQHALIAPLVRSGAVCAAKNRRGAEPLHYAADANHWDPRAQARTIAALVAHGADPNAVDAGGITPLHRAVRTRSAAAGRTLLQCGADPRQRSRRGSTAMHLAMNQTGRGGSGTPLARQQQKAIVDLLREAAGIALV